MKNSMKIFLVVFLFLANGSLLYGQQAWLELGDKYFDQFAYKKAIRLYEGAKDRDPNNWEIYAKLGDCYYLTSKPEIASDYYKIAIDNITNIKDEYLLKYALCLQSTGSSQDVVIKAFQEYYNKIGKKDKIGIESSSDNLNTEPENLSINSKYSDFGSYIFNDVLYFASSREKAKKRKYNKRLYKWNEHPFLDIYEAKIIENSDSINSELMPADNSKININTIAHEAGVTISNDGMYMYFSGGTVKNNRLEYNKSGTSNLKLQRASDSANKWVVTVKDKKEMKPFDFDNYSFGNPALTPDNKWLFFVTCAPYADAQGQTDIYYVKIDEKDGTIRYGKPKNLSRWINTSGRESFPFISKDNTLYFSSDGIYDKKLGSGLLDIYKVYDIDKLIEQRELNIDLDDKVEVFNMGAPFNSSMDDFAFFIEEPKEEKDCEVYAYFSSNWQGRPNAKGDDDIYRVKVKKSKMVQGIIMDSSTHVPLLNASVELINASGMVLKTVQVDSTGAYSFDAECNQIYRLRGSMNGYYDDLTEYNSAEVGDNINLELKPFPCEITVNHIEFNPNSDTVNPFAKNALSEVLEILLANPEVKVRIESFTDHIGSAEYNLDLSERRAQNTKLFLINEGVKEGQITSSKGFGENCLLESEDEINNAPQSERNSKLARNRRSRFILDCNEDVEGCQE